MESVQFTDEYGVQTTLTFNPEVDLFRIIQHETESGMRDNESYSNYPSEVLEKIRDWSTDVLKRYNNK